MPTRSAFTLVELLVVIAIIGILIGMLLPAVQSARESGRNTQCGNQLKQIGLALHQHHEDHGTFPPGGLHDVPAGTPVAAWWVSDHNRTNWAISILPYLDAQHLYDQYDDNVSNRHTTNHAVLQTFLPVMLCPTDVNTDQLVDGEWWTWCLVAPGSYRGVCGRRNASNNWLDYANIWGFGGTPVATSDLGPLFSVVPGVSFPEVSTSQITDGLSNTLLVGERHMNTGPPRLRTCWASTTQSSNLSTTQPESFYRGSPDRDQCVALTGNAARCDRAFSSLHSGNVMNFVTCGGNVVRISPDMDGALFEAAGTIAGGENALLQ